MFISIVCFCSDKRKVTWQSSIFLNVCRKTWYFTRMWFTIRIYEGNKQKKKNRRMKEKYRKVKCPAAALLLLLRLLLQHVHERSTSCDPTKHILFGCQYKSTRANHTRSSGCWYGSWVRIYSLYLYALYLSHLPHITMNNNNLTNCGVNVVLKWLIQKKV